MSSTTTHTLTLQQILADHDPNEHALILAADRQARRLLISGALELGNDHYDAFSTAAEETDRQQLEESKALLREFADVTRDGKAHGAEDVACNHWTPVIGAAYYVGLALGLRLAAGAR